MKINWKTPEAFVFNGANFDELKTHFPQLKKYKREGHEYTVGWDTELIEETTPVGEKISFQSFTEALPGMYLIKNDGKDKIVTPEQFKEDYE